MKLHFETSRATYYHGDARQMDALASESVAMVITSPPYYDARPEYAAWGDYHAYLKDMLTVWQECHRVLMDGGRIAVNVPMGYGRSATPYTLIGMHIAAQMETLFTLRGIIVWYKTTSDVGSLLGTAWGTYQSAVNPSLRDSYEIIIVGHKGNPSRLAGENTIIADDFLLSTETTWRIPPAPPSWHPAPFPAEIPRRLIELYTFKNDVVLDPFSGSGTTVRVAAQLERHGIGVDLNLDYLNRTTEEARFKVNGWENPPKPTRFSKRNTPKVDLPMFGEM